MYVLHLVLPINAPGQHDTLMKARTKSRDTRKKRETWLSLLRDEGFSFLHQVEKRGDWRTKTHTPRTLRFVWSFSIGGRGMSNSLCSRDDVYKSLISECFSFMPSYSILDIIYPSTFFSNTKTHTRCTYIAAIDNDIICL